MPVVSTVVTPSTAGATAYVLADGDTLFLTATGVLDATGKDNNTALVFDSTDSAVSGSAMVAGTILGQFYGVSGAGNGNSLTVLEGGQIFGSAVNAVGVWFSGTATVVVEGLIQAPNGAILLSGGSSAITIGETGAVRSQSSALDLRGAGYIISNAGEISGGSNSAVMLDGEASITNSGRIFGGTSGLRIDGGDVTLLNTGEISGRNSAINAGAGDVVVENHGTIAATGSFGTAMLLRGVGNVVSNTGTISANGTAISFSLTLADSPFGANEVRNMGLISGSAAIAGTERVETVVNEGTIRGAVVLGGGDDVFDGTIGRQRGEVSGDGGFDMLTGGAFGDTLSGGSFDPASAATDADTLLGLGGADLLAGRFGNDEIDGGDGNDTVEGGQGADELEGGAGLDMLSYQTSAAAVRVSLASGEGYFGDAAGDVFSGFEALRGSASTLAGDTLGGDSLNNTLDGLAGHDSLSGGGGRDSLLGGGGADSLVGGGGGDVLRGGGGADLFIFRGLADSALATPDRILDFTRNTDRIDVSAIDANATVGGNQAFTLVATAGAGFTAAGQLRFEHLGGVTRVLANTDNNFDTAEMLIVLTNPSSGPIALAAADFVL